MEVKFWRLSEESHQLQLVLFSQFQFAQRKPILGWNVKWKQILFLTPNTLHSWQIFNRKKLDFMVKFSSYVHTNIKLLNWRWRRSTKYFIRIETKLNIFVKLNPIILIEVVIPIYLFRHDCQCIWIFMYFLHLCQKLQTAVKAPLNQVDRVYAGASTNLWGVVCARNLHISAFLPQFVFWSKLIFKMFSLFLAPCYSDYFCLTHCRLTCD